MLLSFHLHFQAERVGLKRTGHVQVAPQQGRSRMLPGLIAVRPDPNRGIDLEPGLVAAAAAREIRIYLTGSVGIGGRRNVAHAAFIDTPIRIGNNINQNFGVRDLAAA